MTLLARGALAAALALGFCAEAEAAYMTWRIKNEHAETVALAFYSRDRVHQWPGDGAVWQLTDNKIRTYPLICNFGEMICFGAWIKGREQSFWGAGFGGREPCQTCCQRCGFDDPKIRRLEK